jgi:hypothetical protein
MRLGEGRRSKETWGKADHKEADVGEEDRGADKGGQHEPLLVDSEVIAHFLSLVGCDGYRVNDAPPDGREDTEQHRNRVSIGQHRALWVAI